MANSYFQFKKFTIHQDRSAMKVCTDACLFGAWLTSLRELPSSAGIRMLDIGTGTGLLSLMVAQKNASAVDAVEADAEACNQAAANFQASPWNDRLDIIHSTIQEFCATSSTTYDFIFANPPFYENDWKSPDEKRNLALHSAALSHQELTVIIDRLLKPDGMFAILLPASKAKSFEQMTAAKGFFPEYRVLVKQSPSHAPFRVMYVLSRRTLGKPLESTITIRDARGEYSDVFVELLRDYYYYL